MFRCSTEHFKNIYSHSGSCRSVGAGLKNFKRTTWSSHRNYSDLELQTRSYYPGNKIFLGGWGEGGGCKKNLLRLQPPEK